MDWITDVVKVLLDGTYKITHKIGLFMTGVFAILLADNHFGFSKHWANKGKIEEIVKIQELLNQKNVSPALVNKLHEMQVEVLAQKNLLNHFLDFLSSFINQISFSKDIIAISINTKPIEYSLFYHVVSTSFWLLLLFLTVIYMFLSEVIRTKKIDVGNLKTLIQIIGIVVGATIVLSLLTFLIPKFSQPVANYTINFLIITMIISMGVLYVMFKNNNALQKKYDRIVAKINAIPKDK